jgi:multicomponent Na+:H+ antiporter subunit E
MIDTEQSTHNAGASGPGVDQTAREPGKGSVGAFLFTFIILAGIWVLLSGKFDTFHLSLGLFSCLIVTYFSHDLLLPSPNMKALPGVWFRFTKYIPWLLYQVFLANIHVLKLALLPNVLERINPGIIQIESRLKSDLALVTFANSITLTPGTISIYASVYGAITVHVIDATSAAGLSGVMEDKIADVFGE